MQYELDAKRTFEAFNVHFVTNRSNQKLPNRQQLQFDPNSGYRSRKGIEPKLNVNTRA